VNTGSQAAILEDVAATWEPTLQRPSMDEQRNMPRRVHRRRRGSLAGSALRVLLGVLLFVTDALGVSQRARSAWARFMKHASSVSGRWAERLAAGRQMTRKLSAVALNTLGMRMSSNKERVAGLLRRAMSAESRLDTCGAIRCYQAANELVPDDSEPLVGLAKCISDRVFEPDIFHNGELARSMASQAASLSEQAIALKPDNPRAYLASAISLGRLALWSSNSKKIEISRTVRERCMEALKLSPEDDVALHVLGRWEYEMALVGFAVRLIVKMAYGGLEVGSLDAAHQCLARAIELRPERLVHRVVMARILLKQGKHSQAIEQLETACRLRIEDVNAVHERAEAVRMLRGLGRAAPPEPVVEYRSSLHAPGSPSFRDLAEAAPA